MAQIELVLEMSGSNQCFCGALVEIFDMLFEGAGPVQSGLSHTEHRLPHLFLSPLYVNCSVTSS